MEVLIADRFCIQDRRRRVDWRSLYICLSWLGLYAVPDWQLRFGSLAVFGFITPCEKVRGS